MGVKCAVSSPQARDIRHYLKKRTSSGTAQHTCLAYPINHDKTIHHGKIANYTTIGIADTAARLFPREILPFVQLLHSQKRTREKWYHALLRFDSYLASGDNFITVGAANRLRATVEVS